MVPIGLLDHFMLVRLVKESRDYQRDRRVPWRPIQCLAEM